MTLVVPDASVILKWVLPAEDELFSEQAWALREQYLEGKISFAVPALWLFEAGNTLARKLPNVAFDIMQDLQSLGMSQPEPSVIWLEKACSLARQYKVAFYDAAYHALAIVESSVLVTADVPYLQKAGSGGHICHITDWRL